METPPNSNNGYSHVLQQSGVLKNFSVAKIVSKKQVEDLKLLIRAVAKDEKEYEKMLAEEMAIIANMHDLSNPIPGIIYFDGGNKPPQLLLMAAKEFAAVLRSKKLTKRQIRFILSAVIKELNISPEDFFEEESDPENGDAEKA
jgi:hypothetical protein